LLLVSFIKTGVKFIYYNIYFLSILLTADNKSCAHGINDVSCE